MSAAEIVPFRGSQLASSRESGVSFSPQVIAAVAVTPDPFRAALDYCGLLGPSLAEAMAQAKAWINWMVDGCPDRRPKVCHPLVAIALEGVPQERWDSYQSALFRRLYESAVDDFERLLTLGPRRLRSADAKRLDAYVARVARYDAEVGSLIRLGA